MGTAQERAAELERRRKEKAAEEQAAAARREEERLKREEQKKQRDAERKKEEEEAKRQRAAGAKTADADDVEMADTPDVNINAHLNDINSGGAKEDGAAAEETKADAEGDTREEGSSPPKKKKKKDKKRSSKDKDNPKEKGDEEKAKEGVASVLKKGRFSGEGVEAAKKKEGEEKKKSAEAVAAARAKVAAEEELKEARRNHIHEHNRMVVECSFICTQEDEMQRFNELPLAVRAILKNMQKVDKWACLEPVEEGDGERIYEVGEVPFDHTDLGTHVLHSGGTKSFELRRPKKGKKQEEWDIDDWVKPEIYFTIAFSSDKEPQKILDRIGGEWAKVGGNKLWLKEIPSFSTKTAFTIFHLRNNNTYETIAAELKRILEEGKDILAQEPSEGYFEYTYDDIPQMGIRKQVPRVDGMDTSIFQGWDGRKTDLRKTLQIEVEEKSVPMIQCLVEKAKLEKIFEKYFGPMVRVSLVSDSKGPRKKGGHQAQMKVDLAAMASYCRKHVNYQSCTRMDGLRGILDLDKDVLFYSVTDPSRIVGSLTLRRVLYTRMVMSDGHRLFEEVHQAAPMGAVDVVVPNCAESEKMLTMMNRNIAAYLTHYLVKVAKMEEGFVNRLVRATVDPSLVNAIEDCRWNEKEMIITTPEDEEQEKLKAMEDAAWYNDEFGDHMVDTSKKEKMQYASKEALDELNCDHSYKSVHQKKGNYVGSPDAPTFQVGGKAMEVDISSDEEEDEGGVDLEKMSHAELVKLLKKAKITAKSKGSPPSDEEKSGSGRSVEEDSSSGSSSSSSSSSGSSVHVQEKTDDTSPPSDGGSTAARTPGPGE